ncbi:hypothetical protein B0H63DRAFT_272477 [Podospora didyma]|uniref:Life-span regulatory factor domain-containing protein n=1 Tax=Podospora didyma TaxID=330526 RepID=A0AAE0N902_9PEZI|nr:hypothetical protein B0H63DRAFT_272477 [Podospora didyma]
MHHQRRKSGHNSGNSSMTDVRKAVTASDNSFKSKHSTRPAPMTRRNTPQTAQKLGKSLKDREKEWEQERWWDEERESFPQYCMICEKQFIPQDDLFLYCSDTCRIHDQNGCGTPVTPSRPSHHGAHYPFYSGVPEPRDIIPRAAPSRPSSLAFPPPATSTMAFSPPATSAISALKSLSIRSPSPPSPGGTYQWPFGRSAATSPSSSYSRTTPGLYSSTYDGTYYGTGVNTYGTSSDRPLPSRRPGVHSRPKSIELVTPMMGRC